MSFDNSVQPPSDQSSSGDPVPRTRRAHASFRCPRCGNPLSLWAYGRAASGDDDVWELPREYRRCVACLGFAWRHQEHAEWHAAELDGLPADVQLRLSLL